MSYRFNCGDQWIGMLTRPLIVGNCHKIFCTAPDRMSSLIRSPQQPVSSFSLLRNTNYTQKMLYNSYFFFGISLCGPARNCFTALFIHLACSCFVLLYTSLKLKVFQIYCDDDDGDISPTRHRFDDRL